MSVQAFTFGDEQVACTNAIDSTVGVWSCNCADCRTKGGTVYFAMRLPPPGDAAARALYGVYSPDQARELAATILQSANEIDGGKGRQ